MIVYVHEFEFAFVRFSMECVTRKISSWLQPHFMGYPLGQLRALCRKGRETKRCHNGITGENESPKDGLHKDCNAACNEHENRNFDFICNVLLCFSLSFFLPISFCLPISLFFHSSAHRFTSVMKLMRIEINRSTHCEADLATVRSSKS